MTPVGINIISSRRDPAWPEQLQRLEVMRPEVLKVQMPVSFGTSTDHIGQAIERVSSIQTVILRGMDCDVGYTVTKEALTSPRIDTDGTVLGNLVALVRDFPEITFWVEVGNEPENCGKPINEYRADAFDTVRHLREEFEEPNLRWTISLPVEHNNALRLIEDGKYETICDGFATHLYAHHDLYHPTPNWKQTYDYIRSRSELPILITEAGVHDPAMPDIEKVQHYIEFAESLPLQVEALVLFGSISDSPVWADWKLDEEALSILGARLADDHDERVGLATPVYQPGATADVTTGQMKAVIYLDGHEPAYGEQKIDAIVHRWAHWCGVFGFLRSATWGQGPGKETGWFWSRVPVNQVHPDQNNWGGLGADNSGAAGATFGPHEDFFPDVPWLSAIDHGCVAFMAHLGLYVFGEPEHWPEHLQPYVKFAYRLDAVRWADANIERPDGSLLGFLGAVEVIGDFENCRWAHSDHIPCGSLDNGYARGIAANANLVHVQRGGPVDIVGQVLKRCAKRGIETHDLRGQMPHHQTKNAERRAASTWRYTIVHHTAVSRRPASLSAEIESWENHAHFHINTRGWPRIAYTIGISPSGRLFGLKDMAEVGYHAFAGVNYQGFAIAFDRTTSDPFNAAEQQALLILLDVLHNHTPELPNLLGPAGTYGHLEVRFLDPRNDTECPGDPVLSLVRGYRTAEGELKRDDPNATYFEDTGHWVINLGDVRMLDLWRDLGGLSEPDPVGYPLTGMVLEEDNVYRQVFENRLLEWYPGGGGRSGALGRRYLELRDRAAELQIVEQDACPACMMPHD